MRPIPKAVQKILGPFVMTQGKPEHFLAERPWWSWSGVVVGRRPIGHGTVRRADGITFTGSHTDAGVFAERTDLERPVPHPGWRVGQVWSNCTGYAQLVIRLDDDGLPVFSAGSSYTELDVDDWLMLLADPIRPYAAPWSPAASPHVNRRSDESR